MIKNAKALAQFEKKYLKKSRRSLRDSFKILDALWKEGVALGKLPLRNPLEGIEKDIRIAKALNPPRRKPHV